MYYKQKLESFSENKRFQLPGNSAKTSIFVGMLSSHDPFKG